jgi:hypothetical protein
MSQAASLSPQSALPTPQPNLEAEARAARLKAANINPRTGLATDYLNHFNEAIMLLEMIPDLPECAEDFMAWRPLSYPEHFIASNFKARDLAIEAYEQADEAIRAEFDSLTGMMTSILTAVGAAMRESKTRRPAPGSPSRRPAGSSRWPCLRAASSMAGPNPMSITS